MAQIIGYPGVYIEEFTPPSPIEGIGTSTAAFIGTAEKGPVGTPIRLSSWEGFVSIFGGFLLEQPTSYLAPAVYGFFLNGGLDCFVVRAGTATHATVNLLSRRSPGAEPLLTVTAIEEGPAGGTIQVNVSDSSLLATRLGGAAGLVVHRARRSAQALPTAPGSDRHTITVSPNHTPFRLGERVVMQDQTQTSLERVVVEKRGNNVVILSADVNDTHDYGMNGRLRSADIVPGQAEILVDVPANVRLAQVLPRGTTLQIGNEFRTVESAGDGPTGPQVRLSTAVTVQHDLDATPPTLRSAEFDLAVAQGSVQEVFRHLSMGAEHPNYWGSAVDSGLVRISQASPPPANPHPDPRPVATTAPISLTPGQADDRPAAWAQLLANPTAQLNVLRPFDEVDLVCIPGATSMPAQVAVVQHCEDTRRFAVLDSVLGADRAAVEAQVDTVRGTRVDRPGHAALYYPWLQVTHPVTNRVELWPPSGHVLGLYSRSDAIGVHVAPANDVLRGAFGLERRLTDLDQAPLNLNGINVLRIFPGNALPVVWGARTTYKQNKYWQYVNIRRLFLFLEKSIEEGIRWAVFQPNNQELWQRLKRTISDFLTRVWRDGAFFGATPKEAFFVRIDEALNPETERALGRLYIEIGVRPAYPAEFIVVLIGISEVETSVRET
jgi:phage tail sheath protein FI